MKKHKTREEKIQSGYRLKNFKLQAETRTVEKDHEEFGYLASKYVVADLTKTAIFSLVIVAMLLIAKKWLG